MRLRRHDQINKALPDQLILEIFRRVDSNSNRGAISLVCRRWFDIERLRRRSEHLDSLVSVCDICGDIGVVELITTCSKCKTCCEHAYCRKVLTQNYLDDWLCDYCNVEKMCPYENEKREKRVTFASELPGFESGENTHSALRAKCYLKEKFVNKGKVKCISSKEVIRLCSGSKKGENLEHYNSSAERIISPMCSKTVVHKIDAPSKSPVMPVSLSNSMQTSSMIKQHARDAVNPATETALVIPGKEMHRPSEASSALSLEKQFLLPVSSETTLASLGKEIRRPIETSSAHSLENQFLPPVDSVTIAPSVETRTARKCKEVSVTNEGTPSLKQHLKKPRTSIKAAMKTKEASMGKEASHQVKSNEFSRGPAHASSWKGQFNFFNDILPKFENEARTCSITSHKVLQFSSRMPHQLQFELIHRNKVWTNLFQDGSANEDDIGLYFYSGEEDRSSDYDLVLALIEGQDLALRCELHGVVLYLFTSKILSADYQTWDGHHYLWGVFHKIKKRKDVTELYKELPRKV